jgi:parallel beta-helix repeat protein
MIAIIGFPSGYTKQICEKPNDTTNEDIHNNPNIAPSINREYPLYDIPFRQLIDKVKRIVVQRISSNSLLRTSTMVNEEEWDIIVPDDYPTIQEAIDHSYEYYTIYVRSGLYTENLLINVNAIQLIGENFSTTIIDGSGSGIVCQIHGFLIGISQFTLRNGEFGVTFSSYAPTFNTVYGNVITNNRVGLFIQGVERSNLIYHNNFIHNDLHAQEPTENNLWYDLNIKEGNYWDDYLGVDENGDGIGDTPYQIAGNRSEDKYPLMTPFGIHIFPSKPIRPSGKTHGEINVTYEYQTSAIDQQDRQLYYWFDWGDGNQSQWFGPYQSGEICSASHCWIEKGTYQVRVKVKNDQGIISVWSDPFAVYIPHQKGKKSWIKYPQYSFI